MSTPTIGMNDSKDGKQSSSSTGNTVTTADNKWYIAFHNGKPYWWSPSSKASLWAPPPQDQCDETSWKQYTNHIETEAVKEQLTMKARTRNLANHIPFGEIQGSKEARERLMIDSIPLTKSLLLKYLSNIGWTSKFVSKEIIDASISPPFCQPPDVIDQSWADFVQLATACGLRTKDYFDENANGSSSAEGDSSKNGRLEKSSTISIIDNNDPAKREMDEFFLKCSAGILGSKTVESIHNAFHGIKGDTKEDKEKRRVERVTRTIREANQKFLGGGLPDDIPDDLAEGSAGAGTLYALTRPKRAGKSRLMNVDGFQILKENNYTLEEGIQTISSSAALANAGAPVKPQASRSAYNFFSGKMTSLFRQKDGQKVSSRMVPKLVGEAWRTLPPKEKETFMRMAQEDQERFQREYDQYMVELDEFNARKMELLAAEKLSRSQTEPISSTATSRSGSVTPTAMSRSSTAMSAASDTWGQFLKRPYERGGAPRIGVDNLVDAAIISMGPRSMVSQKQIISWIENSLLGNLMTNRLRMSWDTAKIERSIKRGISLSRYSNRRDHGVEYFRMSGRGIREIAKSLTLEEAKANPVRQKRPRRATDDDDDDYSDSSEFETRIGGSVMTRAENNDTIKRAIVEDARYRWAFFIRHKDVLLPFVDDSISGKLDRAEAMLRSNGFSELLDKSVEADPRHLAEVVARLRSGAGSSSSSSSSSNGQGETSSKNAAKSKAKANSQSTNGKILLPQPSGIINGEMRQYQLESLTWLVNMFDNGADAILADEMGLGKTLQTIAFLSHLRFERNIKGPYLVIVPLSVLTSWCNEFRRWCPDMRVIKMHSSAKDERDRLKRDVLNRLDSFDVIVTTYEMIISSNMRTILTSKIWWRLIVIDEGHKIKNDETELSQAVRAIHSQHRLLLTGTPLQNNLHELWAMLNFLFPEIFQTSEKFDSCFDLSRQMVNRDMLEKAHYLLRPFVLRRTKFEVEQTLPTKDEVEIKVPLSKMQMFWYKRLLLKDSDLLARVEASLTDSSAAAQSTEAEVNDWKKLQSLMMQLRKCCDHPFLFPDAEPDFDGSTDEDLVDSSGKLKLLDRLLRFLQENGHRVVIFSQFTSMLDILQDFCTLRNYKFSRLDGSVNRVQRAIDILQYNQEDSQHFIYLMSTRAGGLGINLATADTVILYDSDWNPQVDLQAMDRVHRIGQTKPVHVYRLICGGTVEERIVQRAKKKLFLDRMVNRGSTMQAEMLETLSKAEMLKMLKFGATSVIEGGSNQGDDDCTLGFSDADLLAIINRKKTKKGTKTGGDNSTISNGAEENALEFDEVMPMMSLSELNGVDIRQQAATMANADASRSTTPSELSSSTPVKMDIDGDQGDQKGDDKNTLTTIADEWRALQGLPPRAQRTRTSRYVQIGGYNILKTNNYTLEEGEKSVFDQELASDKKKTVHEVNREYGRGRQVAGRDYQNESHCLSCWDGGDILLCDQCPASFHLECMKPNQRPKKTGNVSSWGCPHHSCKVCGRKAAAAGGLLFRCTECPNAYCEDHLPLEGIKLLENGRCQRFEELGMRKPAQAYYMNCSKTCVEFAQLCERIGVDEAVKQLQEEGGKRQKTS